MKRIIALALAITAGSAAYATDDTSTLVLDAATTDQITTMLTTDGYEVRKVEIEDGMYEAYAMKDGQRIEVFLDKELNIFKTKIDD